jgi:heat shock protein HslJ
MKMSNKIMGYVTMVYLLVLNGCSFSKKMSDPEEVLFATDWILYKLKGSNISLEHFAEGAPYLKFNPDNSITIFTGCNSINGKFFVSGNYLTLDFASDSGMCPVVLANDFINSLKDSKRYILEKEKLILWDQSTPLMAFYPK